MKTLILLDSVMQWLQTGIVDAKAKWKNTVNQAIGYYEYCTWRAECMMYKRMDTFECVVPEPSLCIWWLIALWDVRTAGNCRFMLRLMCRENVLECNVGRYKGIPRGERICPLCKLTEEDETHFLWCCEAFDSDRKGILQVVVKYINVIDLLDMPFEERTHMVLGVPSNKLSSKQHVQMLWELSFAIGKMYKKRLEHYKDTFS